MISVYIDTNCINARQNNSAINELERLYDEEMILIEKTDTLDTELSREVGYPQGQKKSLNYIESYGPVVIGYSRIGSSIIGSEEDDKRLGAILEILWGKRIRSSYSSSEMGDAMHIATAVRYGGTFFITNEKNLLQKSIQIQKDFGLEICLPKDCVEKINERIKEMIDDGYDPRQ